MAIKQRKPTTPARRQQTVAAFDELTGSQPHKPLTKGVKRIGGRNNKGRTTIWYRGGSHKRRYRVVDFRREKIGVPAKVVSVEYDPNRSARISLLHYADGEKRYILWVDGLAVGDEVVSGPQAPVNPGNTLPLSAIPVGTIVHNIELKIGKGGQMVRSAGAGAQLMAKEGRYALVRLPSSEMRKVHIECSATIGQVGNLDHEQVSLGKAGRKRWAGRRPHNRGVTKNPVDHPMGGGEGRTAGGRHPCSPTAVLAKGGRTRSRSNPSNKFIIRRRKK